MPKLSLIQRLWAMLLLLVLLASVTSLAANLLGARDYLQQQLSAQNADTANALALLISQHGAERGMGETLINASFDQGHFRRIRWQDARGQTVVDRDNPHQQTDAPTWFREWLPIAPKLGVASINRGWQQAGELRVESDLGYAYASLWQSALHTLAGLVGVVLLTGLVGSIDILRIRRQLDSVVEQARALSERRFMRIAIPSIPELSRVAQAMNLMVERLQSYLDHMASEIHQLRTSQDTDSSTGIPNRNVLQRAFENLQAREGAELSGQLLLLRILDLAELNARIGASRTDELLQRLANDLTAIAATFKGAIAARLRGADFALLCPGMDNGQADRLAERLLQQCSRYESMGLADRQDIANLGLTAFNGKESFGNVLSRASQALTQACAAGNSLSSRQDGSVPSASEYDWRQLITRACAEQRLALRYFPVVDAHGRTLWQEGMLYLPAANTNDSIGALQLLSHSLRLGISQLPDLLAVDKACQMAATQRTAVNLSPASLHEPGFTARVMQRVQTLPPQRLNFEFHEMALKEHWDAFSAFCRSATEQQQAVAVEISGNDLALVARLGETGITYLVVDGMLTRGISHDAGREAVVKGLLQMGTIMGIKLIAKGVIDSADGEVLARLGVWGLTGPAIGNNFPPAGIRAEH